MEKKKVTVNGATLKIWCLPDNLQEFIAYIQHVEEKIPEEYRNGAYIEFDIDDCGSTLEIKYVRDETDEELAKREASEESFRQHTENKEYREYLRLSKKFGEPK